MDNIIADLEKMKQETGAVHVQLKSLLAEHKAIEKIMDVLLNALVKIGTGESADPRRDAATAVTRIDAIRREHLL